MFELKNRSITDFNYIAFHLWPLSNRYIFCFIETYKQSRKEEETTDNVIRHLYDVPWNFSEVPSYSRHEVYFLILEVPILSPEIKRKLLQVIKSSLTAKNSLALS